MLRTLSIIFMVFSFQAVAQEAFEIQESIPPVISEIEVTARSLQEVKEEILQIMDAQYTARLNAMEMERASFDTLILSAKWLGGLASILLLGFAFIAGRSLREIRETSKNEAKSLFENEMRLAATETGSLKASLKEVSVVEDELKRLKNELSGYTDLTTVVRSATGFDPLVQYQSLNKEIIRRRAATISLASGDDSIDIGDTIAHVDFRQRAAVVFEALISTARDGFENGGLTIDANTLFNASQNASSADMEFVALEFLEIASAISGKARPVYEASLIRKKITMSRYHAEKGSGGDEQAWSEIETVLSQISGHELHLVVSEAFNIGLVLADPVRMSKTIQACCPEQLGNVSYSQMIRARLMLIGGETEDDWRAGRELFRASLLSLKQESPSVRWYEHTAEDVPIVLSDDPKILDDQTDVSLHDVFSGCENIRQFVGKFGTAATQGFQQLDLLKSFLDVDNSQVDVSQNELMEMLQTVQAMEAAKTVTKEEGTSTSPEDE